MRSKYAWLFDNERASDVRILIATAPPPSDSNQLAASVGVAKSLHGHSIVLASASEYFRVATADQWSSRPAKRQKVEHGLAGSRHEHESERIKVELEVGGQDGDAVVKVKLYAQIQISVLLSGKQGGSVQVADEQRMVVRVEVAPELFAAAEQMIRYIYAEELDPGLSIHEVLQVARVADLFGVEELLRYCAARFLVLDEAQWSKADMVEVLDLPACILGTLPWPFLVGQVATLLTSKYRALEKAWGSKEEVSQLEQLPYEAMVELLQFDDLEVVSENVVLCTAVKWLRGERGQAASLEDRISLFGLVRWGQLSPAGTQILLRLPERKQLVSEAVANAWVLYLSAVASSAELPGIEDGFAEAPLFETWSQSRTSLITSEPWCEIELDVAEWVARVATGDRSTLSFPELTMHRNGFLYTPTANVMVIEDTTTDEDSTTGQDGATSYIFVGVAVRSCVCDDHDHGDDDDDDCDGIAVPVCLRIATVGASTAHLVVVDGFATCRWGSNSYFLIEDAANATAELAPFANNGRIRLHLTIGSYKGL